MPGRLIGSIAFALMASATSACGFIIYEGMYRVFLMRPEVAGFHELAPYYFTTNTLFEPGRSIEASGRPGQQRNVLEWQGQVGANIPLSDIREALYDLSPTEFWRRFDELSKGNAFVEHLASKDTTLLAYLRYARRCEKLVNDYDPWEFTGMDQGGIDRALDDGRRMLSRATSDFLRIRIAYQLIRAMYYQYGGDWPEIQRLYHEEVLPHAGSSWIGPSARFYAAQGLDADTLQYELSRVFDEGIDKRFRCRMLFETEHSAQTMHMARNDHERAVIHAMACMRRFGRAAKDIERIAALDPKNSFLPFLLVREVNKIEDWLLTSKLTEFPSASRFSPWGDTLQTPSTRAEDLRYLQQIHGLLHTVLDKGDADQRPLYHLLCAHLSFIAGNLDDAEEHLRIAENLPDPKSAHLLAQLRMERVMLDLSCEHKLTPRLEAAIMSTSLALETGDDVVQASTMRDQLLLFVAGELFTHGDVARAGFLLCHSERAFGQMAWGYTTPLMEIEERANAADYDHMIALLEKPDKSSFEQWLTDASCWQATGDWAAEELPITREKLLDYKSRWYVNQDEMEKALEIARLIPEDYWQSYPYSRFNRDDPFRVDVADPCNAQKKDLIHYNKRQLLEEFICLRKEAERNPARRALNTFLLANARFNMSYHGKYWIMSRSYWTSYEPEDDDKAVRSTFWQHYAGLSRAKAAYVEAMRLAKDPELKALACFMADHCDARARGFNSPTSRYIKELRDDKAKEAYASITECIGYEGYIARYR